MTTYDEDEWTVDGFLAECDQMQAHPPTPPDGIELIECTAEPRHWPMYMAHVEGMYPGHCLFCERDALAEEVRRATCEREHRRWKSWDAWGRLSMRLYVLGITSSGGGIAFGRCEFCGITCQHAAPRWRGKRPYILGQPYQWWSCLRRGHRYSPLEGGAGGLCSVCLPCPDCGSADPEHAVCGGAA
jgi:hypothetical protein